MRTLGLLTGMAAVAIAFLLAGPVRAAKFDSPPQISDRRVTLTWQPDSVGDEPDPYFSGNAVLKKETAYTTIHQSGHAVKDLLFSGGGETVYSRAEGEPFVRHWSTTTAEGVAPDFIPLTDLSVVNLSLHSSEAFLLGALATPEIAFWRLKNDPPSLTRTPISSPILSLRFLPAASDTGSVSFVSVSQDDSIRVWRRPGVILSTSAVIGGASGASAVTPRPASNDFLVAAGTKAGRIRIWNSLALGNANLILADQNPHAGPVTRVAFSPDSRRLASTDASGVVRIWSLADGSLLGEFQTNQPSPFLSFPPPLGALLLVGLQDGTVEIHDGTSGAFYKRENFIHQTITSMELSPGGGRLLLGDANGVITSVQAGFCKPSPEQPSCFGGYMVWRSPTPDPDQKELLRVYTFGDSTWTFAGRVRSFTDPDSIIPRTSIPTTERDQVPEEVVVAGPHNGVPYFYSLTRFDYVYLSQGSWQVLQSIVPGQNAVYAGYYRDPGATDPTPVIPRPLARPDVPGKAPLGDVRVVPNPYERGKSGWELPGEMHVEFQNLPAQATVRIYTLGGDFLRELIHGPDKYQQATSTLSWDLKNSSGRWVTSGVYVYQIKSPRGEVEQGYFTVIL